MTTFACADGRCAVRITMCAALAVAWGVASGLAGEPCFDPAAAQWGKSHTSDIRVVTLNVQDGLRTTANKTENFNSWTGLARSVAALRPDVLLLQETGDTLVFGGVDSVNELNTVIDIFFRGGADPFLGGQVTSYVQKYAPGYDLPYVFVSSETDTFNRNIIVSRFPAMDLNCDNRSVYNDIPSVTIPNAYAVGGDGGIRGFALVELDLPDDMYRGDLVVGNAHFKAGGSASDLDQRLRAAKNVAYVLDYWYHGAGGDTPDPVGAIFDFPRADCVLDEQTPFIIGGDWNEDELTNGRRGPAEWLTQAQFSNTQGGTDGTDKDRTDAVYDAAVHPFSGERATHPGSGRKLDYLGWQDSTATARRTFIFNTTGTPIGALPPEFAGLLFPGGGSGLASDHRPVVADFILPLFHDGDGDGEIGLDDFSLFDQCVQVGSAAGTCAPFDFDDDHLVGLLDFGHFMVRFGGGCVAP